MSNATIYPFRQVLTRLLKQQVLNTAVPAINADLTAQMTAVGIAAAAIPQFSNSNVVMGELSPVREATICLLDSGEDNQRTATEGLFYLTLRTQIQIKTPSAGDNSPEDFTVLGQICTDTLRDLLSSQANATLIPKNAEGQNLLPAGMAFQDCFYMGARSLNFPNREADKTTYTRGWIVMHSASICYFQNRPFPLGS